MSTNTTKPRTTINCATAADATAVANLLSEPRVWGATLQGAADSSGSVRYSGNGVPTMVPTLVNPPGGIPTVTVSGTTVSVLGSGNTAMIGALIASIAGSLSADVQLFVDAVTVAGP